MSVVGRYNSKQLYFPEKLINKLNTIKKEALTIVEAPLGYGKTTALHHFFDEEDVTYEWLDVSTKDCYRTFDELCVVLKRFDEHISAEFKKVGFPVDDELCDKCIKVLKKLEFDEIQYMVIDNYQNVSNEMLNRMLVETSKLHNQKLHIVIMTNALNGQILRDKVFSGEANYIAKSDFEFTTEEIEKYYRKCGLKISEEEAEYLQKFTDGWISAIYLQLLHYIEDKSFQRNIGINTLIGEMLWDKLSIDKQDLLIKLGLFDYFTLRQAVMLAGDKLNEQEVKQLLTSNMLISYDSLSRKYYIHGLLKYFLKQQLEELEPIFKNDIYIKAGNWYEGNKDYFKAIQVYYGIEDYEGIYRMKFNITDIEKDIVLENKEMFINIVKSADTAIKGKYMSTALVLSLVLFLYHEKDFFADECEELLECLNNKEESRSTNIYKGNLELLFAFNNYNKLELMKEHFEKACEYMKIPTNLMSSGMSWSFRTPSVFNNLYRSEANADKQIAIFEEIIPYYYKLTGGRGKGAEALMKAELLLNQMDFESAEILCHKAIYMAETRHQTNIYITAMFCLGRISVYKGDFENVKFTIRSIYQKLEETNDFSESIVVDMAESYIKILMGSYNDISSWLKDNTSIEKKCVIFNMGFSNMIYGRYLIEQEQYSKFVGISGQMLGVAGIYNSVIYNIYTLIYIAIADYQLGHVDKFKKFICEAIDLAIMDKIYLPFVDNYNYLQEVGMELSGKYLEFMESVAKYAEVYGSRFKVVKSNNYGLTKREYEIARLAADRLTNREIALKLHITENTVKSNLKNVFSKLDIKSRASLSKLL